MINDISDSKFANAKLMLPESDKWLLYESENIINSKDAMQNPNYDDVCSCYEIVKELLIKIVDTLSINECEEYVKVYMLAINKLSEALKNYYLSAHHGGPNLNSKTL